MKTQWMWRATLVGLLLVLAGAYSAVISPSVAQAASCDGASPPCAEDPAIDACLQCHSMTITGGNRNGTDRPITLSNTSQRHILGPPQEDWLSNVVGMIAKGAAGTAGTIAAYLNTNYCTTCIGPILSTSSLSGIAFDRVTVSWTTSANGFGDLAATSCVLYGTSSTSLTGDTCNPLDPSYDPNSGNMVTNHQVTVTGLSPLTNYYVVHRSVDGPQSTSYALASSFTTPPDTGGGCEPNCGALSTVISLAVGEYSGPPSHLDLAVGVSGKDHVITYLGNGLGQFTQGQTLAGVGTTPIAITSGGVRADFDEDGLDDLAVAYFAAASQNVKVFFGTTPSGFETTPISTYPLTDPPTGVVAGDFNEDGVLDLAVATVHTESPAMGHVLILPGINDGAGHGTGSFGAPLATLDIPISTVLAVTITDITPSTVDCLGLPVDITITGELLLNGATVMLDSSVVLQVISYTDNTSIVARLPNGTAAGAHSVTVEVSGLAPASYPITVEPRPVTITSVSPVSRVYGIGSSGVVRIYGTNFTAGSTVSIGPLSGTTVAATGASAGNPFVWVTSSQVQVYVTNTSLLVDQYDVYVGNNDACGGLFTLADGFAITAPQPTITSTSDPSVVFGVTSSQSISINGANFLSGAQLTVGGYSGTVVPGSSATALSPFVFVSNTRLAYYWANTSLPPGPHSVSVTNPVQAGELSATLADAITVVSPQPAVTSVVLSPVTYGVTSSRSVTINGSNFVSGSVITVGTLTGTTVTASSATATVPYAYISSTQLRFWWNNTSLAPGSYHVQVDNTAASGELSTQLTNGFVVNGAMPTLTSVSIPVVTYGVTGNSSVGIIGTNFVLGATITVGSLTGQTVSGSTATAAVPFVFVSNSSLRFYWGNTSLAPGTYTVLVTNPTESGGGSVSLVDAFTVVAPEPTISNLSPAVVTYAITNGSSITVFGSNFVLGSTITIGGLSGVTVSGSTASAATPFVYTSSSNVKFYWANTSLPPGVHSIAVSNPAAAGGLGATLTSAFTVTAPQPTVTSVSPSPVTYGVSSSVSVTIFGTNFVVGSTVTVGSLSGTTVAGSSATASVPFVVPSSGQAKFYWVNRSGLTPGSYAVTVSNPSPAGGLSVTLADAFVVTAPQPVIDPSSVYLAAWGVLSNRAINVYGSGFVAGATLTVGTLTGEVVAGSGATAAAPFVLTSSSRIQFWWANTSLPVGSYTVSVVNPTDAGGLAATAPDTFIVTAPQPVITSPLSPASVTYGVTSNRAIIVNGSNFAAGATISLGTLTGQVVAGTAATAAVPFVYVSSSRLSVWWNNTSLPVGSHDVTVTNPAAGGGLATTLTGGFVVQ
jgi:hypothetical protein